MHLICWPESKLPASTSTRPKFPATGIIPQHLYIRFLWLVLACTPPMANCSYRALPLAWGLTLVYFFLRISILTRTINVKFALDFRFGICVPSTFKLSIVFSGSSLTLTEAIFSQSQRYMQGSIENTYLSKSPLEKGSMSVVISMLA